MKKNTQIFKYKIKLVKNYIKFQTKTSNFLSKKKINHKNK